MAHEEGLRASVERFWGMKKIGHVKYGMFISFVTSSWLPSRGARAQIHFPILTIQHLTLR